MYETKRERDLYLSSNASSSGDVVREGQHYPFYLGEDLDASFHNEAGYIQNLVQGQFSGCALIWSSAGAVRSNHWHRTDSHYLHVVSGKLLYFETPVDEEGRLLSVEEPQAWIVHEGETILTGPRVLHALAFLEDTMLVSVSKLPRDHESHEADLVRQPFIEWDRLNQIAPWVRWHGV